MKPSRKNAIYFLFALLISTLNLNVAKASIYDNPKAVEALSMCLKETQATMYGTAHCGHCDHNKEYFGPYFRNVRFVDCRSSRETKKECKVEKVGNFPKWKFGNGNYAVRPHSIEEIANASGCSEYVTKALGGSSYTTASTQTSSNNSYETTTSPNAQTSDVYGNKEELAKCLNDKGVIFYGSPRCSHCDKQKAMFEGAFEKHLMGNFHNCKGSPNEQSECFSKRTFPFPTWIEPSTGKKLPGPEKSLELIANTFSCTLADRGSSVTNASHTAAPTTNNANSNWGQKTYSTNSYQPEESTNSEDLNKSNNDPILNTPQEKPNTMVAASSTPSYFDREKALIQQRQDKLASCLVNKNITLYGVTDPDKGKPIQFKATQQQLNELGDAAKKIKIVDCSVNQAECAGILVYPTWILGDSKKELAGVYELSNLANILGCQIE